MTPEQRKQATELLIITQCAHDRYDDVDHFGDGGVFWRVAGAVAGFVAKCLNVAWAVAVVSLLVYLAVRFGMGVLGLG